LLLREQKAASRARAAAYLKCQANVGDLVDALTDLNSRLDVGLTFSSYSDRVGEVRAAYDRMDVNSESLDCLAVGVPAESAMNAYITAHSTWNDCIQNIDCNTDDIDPQLQAQWSKAALKVDSAVAALRRIKTRGGPAVGGWTKAVPSRAAAVDGSIYGAASRELCGTGRGVAAVEPCLLLRRVLSGGVDENELSDLDKATENLNVAYHFAPARPA
jgi:hypothetical protein